MPDEPQEKTPIVPEEHRFEEDLRVCDPTKVGRMYDVEGWRVERMSKELSDGFKMLKKYRLGATFFGSARCGAGDDIYESATELAHKLSKSGFAVITGGAGGIMEAANKGAFEAGGPSVGLNINLPKEQGSNMFLTEEMTFNYFFTRKVMLTFASEVYIYFPGGFGTMDEFFEILTLIQTKKIKPIPMILYDKKYWEPLIEFMKSGLLSTYETISEEDLSIFTVVDTVDEAYEAILNQVKCY